MDYCAHNGHSLQKKTIEIHEVSCRTHPNEQDDERGPINEDFHGGSSELQQFQLNCRLIFCCKSIEIETENREGTASGQWFACVN